jgi:hypothetical protein
LRRPLLPLPLVPCLLALGALALPACTTTTPKSTYQAVERDLARRDGKGSFDTDVQLRIEKRMQWLVDQHAAGLLNQAEEQYYAAAVLWRAQDPESLQLAMALGHAAAAKGRPDALRYVAYATDRLAVMRGQVQRYGTQMVYSTVNDRWRLYAYDKITTDAERAEMGLPTLAQMQARVDARNERPANVPFAEE